MPDAVVIARYVATKGSSLSHAFRLARQDSQGCAITQESENKGTANDIMSKSVETGVSLAIPKKDRTSRITDAAIGSAVNDAQRIRR
jgi:hypothetical protein